MKYMFDPDNFDMIFASLKVLGNQSSNTLELYLYDCNSLFTELTGLEPDKEIEVSEAAFGKKKGKYLTALFELQNEGTKGELVLRFKQTRKWLYMRISTSKSQCLNLLGFDYTSTQRQLNAFKLQEANKKIIEQNAELEELSLTDHLTGLSNRRSIQQVLNYLIKDYKRTGESFSVLMLDIDNFKKVNDKHGHDGGDTVLSGISKIFQDNLRQIDVKARWGGEEFLLLLPHTDKTKAKKIAENLLILARNTIFEHKNINIQITFSGGLATYNQPVSLQTLLHDADKALYKAKKNGRNRIVVS